MCIRDRSLISIGSTHVFHFNLVFFSDSAAENLRCRMHSVFGSVHLWVSLCVLKTLWAPCLKNQWREFHPILVTYVFGFIGVLIRFGGQKVKGQRRSRRNLLGFLNTFQGNRPVLWFRRQERQKSILLEIRCCSSDCSHTNNSNSASKSSLAELLMALLVWSSEIQHRRNLL